VSAVSLGLRTAIGCLLVVAGIAKFGAVAETAGVVKRYVALPSGLTRLVGRIIPFVEVFLAPMILVGFELAVVGICAGILFLGFAVAMSRSLARGDVFECGCGLGMPSPISWTRVVIDVLLTGMCAVVAFSSSALTVSSLNDAADVIRYLPIPLIVLLGLAVGRARNDVRESGTTIYREIGHRLAGGRKRNTITEPDV
jgi:hypothetical protein